MRVRVRAMVTVRVRPMARIVEDKDELSVCVMLKHESGEPAVGSML